MEPDDLSGSADAAVPTQFWPLPEREIADAEAVLTQIHAMLVETEQTLHRAKAHLAALDAAAPGLRQALMRAEAEEIMPNLTDLQAAQGLRAELVKAAQESVKVSQAAAKYLQARERFLLARRAEAKRPEN